mmetsp:Transcript_16911/g.42333  ORF Transcript_16911/g.42333 Transcript_16911/m.42333 type:complete len:584 (-) Transcript_16911:349-2100(-)
MNRLLDQLDGLARSPLTACVVGLGVCGVAYLAFFPITRWRYRKIPGPTGLPLVGSLVDMVRYDSTRFLQMCAAKYGPVFKVWWGATPWVVVCDLEAARRIMSRVLVRPDITALTLLRGEAREVARAGLLDVHGPRWRVARRAFEAALMHRRALQLHAAVMAACVDRLCARLGGLVAAAGSVGPEIDVAPLLGDLTLDVVGTCVFGVGFDTQRQGPYVGLPGLKSLDQLGGRMPYTGGQLVQAMKAVFDQAKIDHATRYLPFSLMMPALRPLLRLLANWLPDKNQSATLHARKVIIDTSKALVAAWQEEQGVLHQANGSAADGGDGAKHGEAGGDDAAASINAHSFLARLLTGEDATTGTRLTPTEVVAQVFTFLLAGYETTAATLMFALHLLAAHPDVQHAAAAEAGRVTRGRGAGALAGAAAGGEQELGAACPLLSAVIDEALRLYPPGTTAIRSPADAVQVGGVTIPARAWVTLPIYSLHRDPALWPRAAEFLPQRHLPDGVAGADASLRPITPHAFMPFGGGARACPGLRFALQEARLALAALLAAFRFELPHGAPADLPTRTGITIAPVGGVKLRVFTR